MLLRYRIALGIFMAGLVLSGISALPLQWELSILNRWLGNAEQAAFSNHVRLHDFISNVHSAIEQTYAQFPFFGYGTDWLAFGHFVIAGFFVLPFMDPIRYRAILQVRLAACAAAIALAPTPAPIPPTPLFQTPTD